MKLVNKINKKRLSLWLAGFVVLFLLNVFVEAVVLTYLNLHNTDKNDIYFQLLWVAIGIWLLFAYKVIKKFDSNEQHAQYLIL